MFKLGDDKRTIIIHKGNTGTVRIRLKGYSFGNNDRVYFCMAYPNGTPVKEAICQVVDGWIEVPFVNTDTDYLPAGDYPYAITAATDPVYDSEQRIIDGSEQKIIDGSGVSTPEDDHMIRIKSTTALI